MLRPDNLLQNKGFDGPYHLKRVTRKQFQPTDLGLISVRLCIGDSSFVSYLLAGDFVFQALWEHDLSTEVKLYDASHISVPLDTRLWHSCELFTHPPAWARTRIGFGASSSYVDQRLGGLSDVMIEKASAFLHQQAKLTGYSRDVFTYGVHESVGGPYPLFGPSLPRWMPLHGLHCFFCLSAGLHWTLLVLDLSPDGLRVIHLDGFERRSLPFIVCQV